MKKLTFAIAFLCISTITFAQKGLEIGVRAIPQSTYILNDDEINQDEINFNMAYGVSLGINFTNRAGIETGAIYSEQGQTYDDSNPLISPLDRETKLTYIKIPVMFKFNTRPQKTLGFGFKFGPQIGLFLKDEHLINDEEITFRDNDGNIIDAPKDVYNKIDVGLAVELGPRINVTERVGFNVLLRGDYSLGNIENEDHESYPSGRAASRNFTAGVSVGFSYTLQ